MNIYVGNLSYEATEEDIQQAFEEFGQVSKVTIIKDRETGNARGFGFVEMTTDSEGHAAIENLNGREVKGRQLKVSEAKPRAERPQKGGDRPRGGGRRNF